MQKNIKNVNLNSTNIKNLFLVKTFSTKIYHYENVMRNVNINENKNNKLSEYVENEINNFSEKIPIEEAFTPPSSWYLSKEFYNYEIEKVFKRNWLGLQSDKDLKKCGDYISGNLINQPYVILKDENNQIKSFYNVCSHHASTIASGKGNCKELICPYHGWTYNLGGKLTKCTSMKGIKNFKLNENNLQEIDIERIGNILFINFANKLSINKNINANIIDKNETKENSIPFKSLVSPFLKSLEKNNFNPNFSDLEFVARKEYPIKCNWKVFIDNYCDGGYHVPFAHKDLNSKIKISTYNSEIYEKSSIQIVSGNENNRIGNSAVYCFLYPNIMFNRYGNWLDINVVIPINEVECLVIIEWFIEKHLLNEKSFIEESLKSSELVQIEDVILCENVMKGILSDAYDKGRYVPGKEAPAYQFHKDLLRDLKK